MADRASPRSSVRRFLITVLAQRRPALRSQVWRRTGPFRAPDAGRFRINPA